MPALSRTITDAIGVSDRVSFSIRDAIGVADDVTYTTSTPLPTAIEADTALGGTNVSVGELPTAVEADSSGTGVGVIEVPNSDGFGAGPFGTSPFGATTFTEVSAFSGVVGVGDVGTAAEHDLAIPLTSLVDEGEFAEAIADAARTPVYVVKADWNRNGLYDHPLSDLTPLVTSVSVDRTLTGTLPAEIGLVEGYASAELSITLEGLWSNSALHTTTRTNLATNPSAELNTAGYSVVVTGTLDPALGVFHSDAITPVAGQYYLYSRPNNDGTAGYLYHRCPLVAVTPGTTYTFSAYRYVVGALDATYIGVDWMDGAGVQMDLTSPAGANIVDAGWARGHLTVTVPPGVSYARQFLVSGTVDFNNYARWDAVLAEVGSALGEYFDGDTTGAHWAGVPQASSSTLVISQVDVNDITFDPVDVFAPYRSDSPLYGKPILQTPIYLETGFIANDGPRLERRFTGTVTQVHPQSLARTVELHGIDPVGRMRAPLTLSGVGLYDSILSVRGPDAYRSRINSQWLIDFALRANGIYTSPPARSDAVLSVTGHGSMIPEIGWGGAPEEYYPTYRGPKWTPGRFGGALATVGGDIGRWWLSGQLTAASGTGIGFSMWLGLYPPGQATGQYFSLDLTTDSSWFLNFGVGTDGRPYVGMKHGSTETRAVPTGFTPSPTAGRWYFVGAHASFGATTMTVTFRINQTTYTSTVTIGTRPGNWKPGMYVNYSWAVPFQNFQLWSSFAPPQAPWLGEDPNWVPQASLDPGVNELTGVPELVGVDSWALITTVTDTEGSTFQFAEDGTPQFRTSAGDALYSRQHLITEVISSDHNLADLTSTTDETTIRNMINIKTKTQLISGWKDFYVSKDINEFLTPAHTLSIFELQLPSAAYEFPPVNSTNGSLDAPGSFRYLGGDAFVWYDRQDLWDARHELADHIPYIRVYLQRTDDPTYAAGFSFVLIELTRQTPWLLHLKIRNDNPFDVRFATPASIDGTGALIDGQPAFIIPARIVEEGDEQLETYTDNASVTTYGANPYDVGGSDSKWRQTPQGLRGLATEVLAATAYPVPVLDAVDVPHDPRRALTQRVVLRDPDGLGEVAGTIVGLTQTYSSDGARDKISVRPIAPPGLGVLDDPTHGLLDSTLVLGP